MSTLSQVLVCFTWWWLICLDVSPSSIDLACCITCVTLFLHSFSVQVGSVYNVLQFLALEWKFYVYIGGCEWLWVAMQNYLTGNRRPFPTEHMRPSPTARRRPSPTEHRRTSPTGYRRPSPTGRRRPSLTGHRRPSPTGHRRPSPTGRRRPSPTGHRRPSPTGHRRTSPTGLRRPSPIVHRAHISIPSMFYYARCCGTALYLLHIFTEWLYLWCNLIKLFWMGRNSYSANLK